ncbi:AfsR/SARP family transcriptional regulator [Plantactinospora sp. CA-290183]
MHLRVGERIVGLERSGERCVLATLAFSPGRPVQLDTLIENVWGEQAPVKAAESIASYVRAVRRAVEAAGGRRDLVLNHRPRAYELRVAPAAIDYHRFAALTSAAEAKARVGDHGAAIDGYRQALDLWLADPLVDVTGDWAERRRYTLCRRRIEVLCALFEQQLRVGEHASVAGQATELLDQIVPTDRLVALAMFGLARSGHQAMIPGFLQRAADRMWSAVRVRPSPRITALADRLIREADASRLDFEIMLSPSTGMVEPISGADEERPGAPAHYGVVMTATHNGKVYQAWGPQYILEPRDSE